MPFPLDPHAPGGPRRSEYVRRSFVAGGAPAHAQSDDEDVSIWLATPDRHEPLVVAEADGQPIAALALHGGKLMGDPKRVPPGVMALLQLRRLETRLIISVFGA